MSTIYRTGGKIVRREGRIYRGNDCCGCDDDCDLIPCTNGTVTTFIDEDFSAGISTQFYNPSGSLGDIILRNNRLVCGTYNPPGGFGDQVSNDPIQLVNPLRWLNHVSVGSKARLHLTMGFTLPGVISSQQYESIYISNQPAFSTSPLFVFQRDLFEAGTTAMFYTADGGPYVHFNSGDVVTLEAEVVDIFVRDQGNGQCTKDLMLAHRVRINSSLVDFPNGNFFGLGTPTVRSHCNSLWNGIDFYQGGPAAGSFATGWEGTDFGIEQMSFEYI